MSYSDDWIFGLTNNWIKLARASRYYIGALVFISTYNSTI